MVVRVLTETDNKEWLKAKWSWEGLRRDKDIAVGSFETGIFDHPIPVTQLKQDNPKDKGSPYKSFCYCDKLPASIRYLLHERNLEKELAKRDAPKEERHIVMTLQRISIHLELKACMPTK